MANINTSQQWQTAANNLLEERAELDAQLDELDKLNFGLDLDITRLSDELRLRDASGQLVVPLGSERRSQLEEQITRAAEQQRINVVKQGLIDSKIEAVDGQISAAEGLAQQSLRGPPNTNAVTPPATVEPNIPSTSVPPVEPLPNPQISAVAPPQTTVVPIPPQPVSVGTVPPDDPEAGEYEARQFLLDQQPVESFAPAPVSDDNLAFEPVSDDDLAFRSAPTVPRDDPQAGEFEAGQFQIAQQTRNAPDTVTVLDPETGLPVETLASVESRQQFQAQETGVSPYGEQDDPPDIPADIDTTVADTEGYIVPDGTINVPPDGQLLREPTALGGDFTPQFDPETQTWGVYDNDTGEFIQTGLTEEQARTDAAIYSVGDPSFAEFQDPDAVNDPGFVPGPISDDDLAFSEEATAAAATTAALRERAQIQAVLDNQQRQADSGDWRFKIRLAPGARYLYRGEDGQGVRTGILAPLAVTDGVIFPYTPTVTTSYIAKYVEQDLPHSNYRGYFYSGSHSEPVTIESVFTAQDTREANYLLAVIHFFRSVTKMFYGQSDALRGAPPPLVFLQGFGAYQFSRHPCVVTRFNYRLPSDVDYIRADVQPISGLNIQQGRQPGGVPPQSLPTNVFTGAMGRLAAAGVPKGAIYVPPPADTLGTRSPTYVPTKMDITLELLPMQTRQQISQVFNMRDFASGSLLRKGFW